MPQQGGAGHLGGGSMGSRSAVKGSWWQRGAGSWVSCSLIAGGSDPTLSSVLFCGSGVPSSAAVAVSALMDVAIGSQVWNTA